MDQYITLKILAKELGLDRSNMRKYVLAKGFSPVKVRTPESRGQLTLALTKEDAELVKETRENEGFNFTSPVAASNNDGYFYIIQVAPDLDPFRIKLGFSNDVDARLQAHRTSAPTAKLVSAWPCKRTWEKTVIASITRFGCELIANEVFTCNGVELLIQRAENFFAIMPSL